MQTRSFGDVTGLLTALAALGFNTLTKAMREARAEIEDPVERLRALGRGYVAFAQGYLERFRLTFDWHRLNHEDPVLRAAGGAAFALLETTIRHVAGVADGPLKGDLLADLVHTWSRVHGFSHLLLAGQVDHLGTGDWAITNLLAGVIG